jgi:putative addiction module component (TIGR02574 family)
MTFDEPVAEAMKLSVAEREALAAAVLASLHEDLEDESEVSRVWEGEAHRRYERYMAGETEASPADEAMNRVRGGLRR